MEVQKNNDTWDDIANRIVGLNLAHSYVLILSLLLLNSCSPLIISFLNRNHHDRVFQAELERFTASYFISEIFPENLKAEHSRQLSHSLQQYKYRVFPPVIGDTRLDFSEDVVLPFANVKKRGEGAYSHVYAFDIPEEYLSLSVGSEFPLSKFWIELN